MTWRKISYTLCMNICICGMTLSAFPRILNSSDSCLQDGVKGASKKRRWSRKKLYWKYVSNKRNIFRLKLPAFRNRRYVPYSIVVVDRLHVRLSVPYKSLFASTLLALLLVGLLIEHWMFDVCLPQWLPVCDKHNNSRVAYSIFYTHLYIFTCMNVCHQFYCSSNTAGHNCIFISIFMTLGYVWGH